MQYHHYYIMVWTTHPMEDAVRICVNSFIHQNYETIDITSYEDERTNVMNYISFYHL